MANVGTVSLGVSFSAEDGFMRGKRGEMAKLKLFPQENKKVGDSFGGIKEGEMDGSLLL